MKRGFATRRNLECALLHRSRKTSASCELCECFISAQADASLNIFYIILFFNEAHLTVHILPRQFILYIKQSCPKITFGTALYFIILQSAL